MAETATLVDLGESNQGGLTNEELTTELLVLQQKLIEQINVSNSYSQKINLLQESNHQKEIQWNEAISEREKLIERLEYEITDCRMSMGELSKAYNDQKRELEDKNACISNLQAQQLETTESLSEEYNKQMERERNEAVIQLQKYEKLRSDYIQMESRSRSYQNENSRLKEQLESLETQNKDLNEKNLSLQQENIRLELSLAQIELEKKVLDTEMFIEPLPQLPESIKAEPVEPEEIPSKKKDFGVTDFKSNDSKSDDAKSDDVVVSTPTPITVPITMPQNESKFDQLVEQSYTIQANRNLLLGMYADRQSQTEKLRDEFKRLQEEKKRILTIVQLNREINAENEKLNSRYGMICNILCSLFNSYGMLKHDNAEWRKRYKTDINILTETIAQLKNNGNK